MSNRINKNSNVRCICNDTEREITCGVCGKKEIHACKNKLEVEFRCKVHKQRIICGFCPDLCDECVQAGYVAYGGKGNGTGINNTKTGETIDREKIKW